MELHRTASIVRGHEASLVVAAATTACLTGAAALWATAPAPVTVPTVPLELAVALSVVGAFLLWRLPGHRIAALLAVTGTAFAVLTAAAAVLARGAATAVPGEQAALAVAWLSGSLSVPWMLLILWFPDGRFTARGWRWVLLATAAGTVSVGIAGYLFGPPGRLPAMLADATMRATLGGPFADAGRGFLVTLADASAVLPLVAVPGLVLRYRRAGAEVRQQVRWLLAAVVLTALGTVLAAALSHGPSAAATVGIAVAAVMQPLPALAIAVAVLRYRLWDIDVVVSRALVYAVLWAVLSGLLLVPALVSGLLVGGRGALAAVGVALAVTLLFQPLRGRMQRAVDARVYGSRRRGLQQLARLGAALGAALTVDEVGPRVAATVCTALRVPWAVVWTYVGPEHAEGGVLRPIGAAGVGLPGPALLPRRAASALRERPAVAAGPPSSLRDLLPEGIGTVVPLVAGGELVGLLAVAERAGEPLGGRDLDPLQRFAGECALSLRGMRLQGELQARIGEIEAQAAELRESRQRLVRAQDGERRRIERDLHDGVQQQLVGLAVRLRRLAAAGNPAVRADCEQLAADAEDAVFALQDLAGGIFPGVLTDQGLAAALRGGAARSPLAVRVEVEPLLTGRRFDAEIEAALYFVALEALTNVSKHAPDATASVTLRSGGRGVRLVLEVRDSGPGLPRDGRRLGDGLLNMRDRVAAVGGSLSLESSPGAGTWVRAEVPLVAGLVPLHPAEADSRR